MMLFLQKIGIDLLTFIHNIDGAEASETSSKWVASQVPKFLSLELDIFSFPEEPREKTYVLNKII